MSVLDKEIQLALAKFDELYDNYITYNDFSAKSVEITAPIIGYFIEGWLMSKGLPTHELEVLSSIKQYKESKK